MNSCGLCPDANAVITYRILIYFTQSRRSIDTQATYHHPHHHWAINGHFIATTRPRRHIRIFDRSRWTRKKDDIILCGWGYGDQKRERDCSSGQQQRWCGDKNAMSDMCDLCCYSEPNAIDRSIDRSSVRRSKGIRGTANNNSNT